VNFPIAVIERVKNIMAKTTNKAVVMARSLEFPCAIVSFSFQRDFYKK
jgi:hypothetical protein